ncbi:hypothetical protein BKA63DRAFT_517937 [Paraphoma chrysanthemicola]|nr:hypothetical protein BKA63DRAFT_517937 [Paraphoma chrysanthemicola]
MAFAILTLYRDHTTSKVAHGHCTEHTGAIMTHNTPHQRPRVHLFDSIFWQVLPAHYDKINQRWKLIACLYHEAGSAVMATDRAAGSNSLKAELEMLEEDIKGYRTMVAAVDIDDVIGIYVIAGRQRWRAEQIAKEDLEDLENGLVSIEEKIMEVKADIVYGFEEKD